MKLVEDNFGEHIVHSAVNEWNRDKNPRTLDILLSLYLDLKNTKSDIPTKLEEIINKQIENGNIVKELKVSRGKEVSPINQVQICGDFMSKWLDADRGGGNREGGEDEEVIDFDVIMENICSAYDISMSSLYKTIRKYSSITLDLMRARPYQFDIDEAPTVDEEEDMVNVLEKIFNKNQKY